MRGGVRRMFEGTGGWTVAASAMVFLGTVFVVAILASPGAWQWWNGTQVLGNEQNGVVYYSYQGHDYSFDDVNSFRSGPRTVWIDPSNPSKAVVSVTVAQVSDTVLTAGPYLAATLLLAAGFWRRHRNRRRRLDPTFDPFIAYGEGIDQVTIDRMLADKRAREHRGSSPGGS